MKISGRFGYEGGEEMKRGGRSVEAQGSGDGKGWRGNEDGSNKT